MYGICRFPTAALRKEANSRSEMVTQLIFGEVFEVLERADTHAWYLVRSVYEGYEGWLSLSNYTPIDEKYFQTYRNQPIPILKSPLAWVAPKSNPQDIMMISMGSFLPFLMDNYFLIGSQAMQILEERKPLGVLPQLTNEKIVFYAKQLLNTAYLWGGKSAFGIDCSGFTQLIYKVLNIRILRDSYQQAEFGQTVDYAEIKQGDLAFFSKDHLHISHVGIVVNPNQIIHANGCVRIDTLTKQGIYLEEQKRYTHYLHHFKRLI